MRLKLPMTSTKLTVPISDQQILRVVLEYGTPTSTFWLTQQPTLRIMNDIGSGIFRACIGILASFIVVDPHSVAVMNVFPLDVHVIPLPYGIEMLPEAVA
jgi:hypothetical protein